MIYVALAERTATELVTANDALRRRLTPRCLDPRPDQAALEYLTSAQGLVDVRHELWFGRGQNSSNSKSDLSSSSLLASSSPDFSEASHLSEASSFWDASHLSEASNFWEASHLSEASSFWEASHLSEVSATFIELSDGVSFML